MWDFAIDRLSFFVRRHPAEPDARPLNLRFAIRKDDHARHVTKMSRMIWSARRVSHTFSRVWCMIPERDTADSHRLAGRKRETSSSLEAADRSASVVGVQVWKRVGRASFLLPRLARSRRQGTSHGTPFPGSCRPTEKRCSHDRGNSSDFRGNRFPDRLGDQRSRAGRRTPYRFTPCALSSLHRPANTPLHPRGRF